MERVSVMRKNMQSAMKQESPRIYLWGVSMRCVPAYVLLLQSGSTGRFLAECRDRNVKLLLRAALQVLSRLIML